MHSVPCTMSTYDRLQMPSGVTANGRQGREASTRASQGREELGHKPTSVLSMEATTEGPPQSKRAITGPKALVEDPGPAAGLATVAPRDR